MRTAPLLQRIGLLVGAIAALAMAKSAIGDDPSKPSKPTSTVALFDGRTLDGWKPTTGPGVASVAVREGAITMGAGNPMTGVTTTRTDLPRSNYALTFEAKRTTGNDFFAAATFPVGESFVSLVPGGWGGSVTGLSMIDGASASENVTNHFVKYQNGQWYTFEVAVTDRVIRCKVDGKEVFAFDHEDAQIQTRIEMRGNQPLGFASYRSAGEVRKVEVKTLTADQITEVNASIKQD